MRKMASVSAILHNLCSDSGKGTQVLYRPSNKRSTLRDPENTFHTNASSGGFSFLK